MRAGRGRLGGSALTEFVWGVWVYLDAGSSSGGLSAARWGGCGVGVADGSGSDRAVQSKKSNGLQPIRLPFGQDSPTRRMTGVSAGKGADNICAPADFAV